jgi:Aspartyl protease
MLIGRYGSTSGRPFMDAHITIPSLGVSGPVSFLMDTGADKTVIMPADSKRLGINYRNLRQASESIGIGGTSSDFLESGVLAVRDGKFLHAYDIEFIIMRRRKALENVSIVARTQCHEPMENNL